MRATPLPIIEIGGFSGSGKTTLILELVGALRGAGLAPLVVKHDAHGLAVDKAGSDTDRFFASGTDLAAFDPTQGFLRTHQGDQLAWESLLAHAALEYDLVLVEGFKGLEVPFKIWLRRDQGDRAPKGGGFGLELGREDDRPAAALRQIEDWLRAWHRGVPVFGAVLAGGKSSRMGRPKHLLQYQGQTWLARAEAALRPHVREVLVLGRADGLEQSGLRCLPDVPDAEGPVAGMLAALRWQPFARWVFTACDMPLLESKAIGWLLEQARFGIWTVMARSVSDVPPDPFPGVLEGRVVSRLARTRGPIGLTRLGRAATPDVPDRFRRAWRSYNSPEACRDLAA